MGELEGEEQNERDKCTWYKHEATDKWFPVPHNFSVPYPAAGDNDLDLFS